MTGQKKEAARPACVQRGHWELLRGPQSPTPSASNANMCPAVLATLVIRPAIWMIGGGLRRPLEVMVERTADRNRDDLSTDD